MASQPLADPWIIVTPLLADAWEHKLCGCALLKEFSDIVHSIHSSFDMSI
jgi:hypothetical protein